MKICLINDTHAGARGDSLLFNEFFFKFWEGTFFPYLKEHNIKQIIHLGDVVDRRKFINYKIGGNKGNRIEIPYARFAGQIFRSENSFEFLCNLEKLYSFLRNEINSYEGFKENFISLSYEDRDNDLFKYIFHNLFKAKLITYLKII